MATIVDRMPPCLGQYETGDPECNGAPSYGATLDEELPCLFRDKCVAFGRLLEETNESPEHFIFKRSVLHGAFQGDFSFPKQSDFALRLNERIVRFGIVAGRVTNQSGVLVLRRKRRVPFFKRNSLSSTHRAKLRLAMRRRLRALRAALEQEGWAHLCVIATHLGRPLNPEEVGARQEELFLVDNLRSKRYGALYYRLRRFYRKFSQRPVARFYPRIKRGWAGSVELQIACSFELFASLVSKQDRHRLHFEERDHFDSYRVVVRQVTVEQAAIVADVVKRLAERGQFGFGK